MEPPQAHYDLRKISMDMYKLVKAAHPELSEIIRFADMNRYELGRIRAGADIVISYFTEEIYRSGT